MYEDAIKTDNGSAPLCFIISVVVCCYRILLFEFLGAICNDFVDFNFY